MLNDIDELLKCIAKESSNYFKNKIIDKYGDNFDCNPYKHEKNIYEWHFLKHKINKDDIKQSIISIIFMGILKLPQLELDWSDNFAFKNQLPKIISKGKFKFFCYALHLPINDFDLGNNIEENENHDDLENKDDYVQIEIKDKERNNYNKVLWNLNHLIKRSKHLVNLGINVFFRGRSIKKFYKPVKPTQCGFKMDSFV